MLLRRFFIGWWESEEEWFWPFELFSKLKLTFCKYQTLIKIKIVLTFVYKEYETKNGTRAMAAAENEDFIGL